MGAMNLDDIPRGSFCVLDTNVLLYAEQGASRQAKRLISRIANRELAAVLPQPVWHELSHKLMLAEAMMLGIISGPGPARQLAANPKAVRSLFLYRDKLKALVSLGLAFESCTIKDLLDGAFGFQEKYGLLTTDSMALAVAVRLKADALVTADAALANTYEIAAYRPTDIRPMIPT